MKIKTNISAGMSFEECDAQRDWWKNQAQLMDDYYQSNQYYPLQGLWYPCSGTNPPTPTPSPTPYPTCAGGGHLIENTCITDMSGYCG